MNFIQPRMLSSMYDWNAAESSVVGSFQFSVDSAQRASKTGFSDGVPTDI